MTDDFVDTDAMHRIIESDIVEDYRVAIDVGANDGAWSALMSAHFGRVIAFEPEKDRFNDLMVNVGGLGNVDMHCKAVLERAGSGAGPYVFDAVAIDDFDLDHCGLIRLSASGGELLALRGADRTIRRFMPVLAVSFCGKSSRFGHTERSIGGHIIASGYRECFRSGEYRVFVPK